MQARCKPASRPVSGWWIARDPLPRCRALRAGLGRRLPDLALRLERRRRQPGALRDAAAMPGLRALGAGQNARLVLVVATSRGAGRRRRRGLCDLYVYVCTYDEPLQVAPATLAGCRASHLPAHDLPARRRQGRWLEDGGAGAHRRRGVPDPARQLARARGQHQRGAPAHRAGGAGADARRRPRADARRARRDGRLLRRRARLPGAEPARLLQPRLVRTTSSAATSNRSPPRRLPRQEPPRRRLQPRLGCGTPGAWRCSRSAASRPRRSP